VERHHESAIRHRMDLRDIHICISAYACDPTRGSEPGIGWNLVREVARRHRVWAITRRRNQAVISTELERAPLPNLRMVYFDLPDSALAWKRGQVGIEVYYRLWQLLTRGLVRRLYRDVRLDLTQHVTFGRYWGPTSLTHISAPFIWGPVGGGETAPPAFQADFDRRGRSYEFLRHSARRYGECTPSVRRAAHRAALALAVTPETRARLLAIGTKRVELFSAMGLDRTSYECLSNLPAPGAGSVRFVSIGRLLHWKGFHLGLKAFAAAALPHSQYWIVGDGPERSSLADLVRRLGLEDRVRFCGSLSRAGTLRTLADCHVLVHPSLHDSGGWVCLEAMSAGRPVICLDLGGPAEQITEQTGVKVAAKDPKQAVCDLAQAMTELGCDAELRQAMGEAGRARVRAEYLWERKAERLDALYASVIEGARVATPR
jgi:glycosyltransferase involved in cell wall biosynthesis